MWVAWFTIPGWGFIALLSCFSSPKQVSFWLCSMLCFLLEILLYKMAPSHSYEQEDCDAPYRENAENVCVRQASMSQQYIVNKVSSDGKTHTPKKHAKNIPDRLMKISWPKSHGNLTLYSQEQWFSVLEFSFHGGFFRAKLMELTEATHPKTLLLHKGTFWGSGRS